MGRHPIFQKGALNTAFFQRSFTHGRRVFTWSPADAAAPTPTMRFPARFLFGALTGLIAAASLRSAPDITPSFPPAQDIRRPDLTIASPPPGPAALTAYNVSGRVFITAGDDFVIRVWDARTGEQATGELLHALTGHAGRVLAMRVQDEDTLVSIAEDQTVKTWKLSTGALLASVPLSVGKTPEAVAFSPKGDQFAAAGADHVIKVWDVGTGELLCSQAGHAAAVTSIAFSPNGQKMASEDAAGVVNYWTVPLPPIPAADLAKIEAALPERATAAPKKARRILVFWRADAILHKGGVPAANHAIELLGRKTGAFEADFTRDFAALDPAVLAHYDALVMNSTAHLAIPESAKKAYLAYAAGGGGVVGIHAAIDMFSHWPEGAAVIGATFANHPWHPDGTWAVKVEEPGHPLLRAWDGKNFRMHDEFYEMGPPYSRSDRRVLLTVDLSDPATAGVTGLHRKDRDFALSWIKHYGRGRVFYCDFGHLGEVFQNPAVLRYYLDGIQYALGDLEVDDAPTAR